MDPVLIKKIGRVVEDHEQIRGAVKQLEDHVSSIMRDVYTAIRRRGAGFGDEGKPGPDRAFSSTEEAEQFGLFVLSRSRDPDIRAAAAGRLDSTLRDMSTSVDSSGAAMVPLEFSNRIKLLIEAYGAFARNAFHMPMNNAELVFLKQIGEIEVYWIGEGRAPTESEPKMAKVRLSAKQWGALTYYPETLREDSAAAVGEMIARSMARGFARKLDVVGFTGNGCSEHFATLGVIPKLLKINGTDDGGGLVLGSGNAWSELTLADFEKVQGRLPEYAATQPRWYCSRTFYFNVMVKLMLAAGGTTAEEIEGRRTRTFLGDPVEFVQVMPRAEANSQVCALYGDLAMAATIGDRRQMTVKESAEYKFAEQQITVLGTQRIAVSVEDLGTDTEAGPIVGLLTAAS